jgi:purine-binding chemotaxis protein CheW
VTEAASVIERAAQLAARSDEPRELLEERASLLAKPLSRVDETQVVDVVCFHSGGEPIAVHTQAVREVASKRRVIPLPNTPAFVLGVINLHGEILPLIDLAQLVGGKGGRESAELIVLHLGSGIDCAVPADGNGHCVSVKRDAIEPADRLGRRDLPLWVTGLLRIDGQVATLIDPARLLEGDQRILAFSQHSIHRQDR